MLNSKELSKLLKEITILYVEDECEAKNEISQTLENFSKNILSASNGREAIELYKNNEIQLIITDLQMPLMNGVTLIESIRKTDIHTPVIILTAHATADYLLPCANLNIQSYIVKPINFQKLKKALYKVVEYLNLTSNILVHIDKELSYDKINGILKHKTLEYKLNNKEKSLMDLLVQNKNKVITYSQIEQEVWLKNDEVMSQSALRTVVKNLRKKSPVNFIENISGTGYKLFTD
jgi:DNA-binding response OmpR family regulator